MNGKTFVSDSLEIKPLVFDESVFVEKNLQANSSFRLGVLCSLLIFQEDKHAWKVCYPIKLTCSKCYPLKVNANLG